MVSLRRRSAARITDMPRKSYVWVTWITKLLAGIDRCEWALWYKANHPGYARVESRDFDLEKWTAEHDYAVLHRAKEMRDEGHVVQLENANKFSLTGEKSILGGKPDIFARSPLDLHKALDVKTGKEKESDRWQVKIYIFALPRVVHGLGSKRLIGILEYATVTDGKIVSRFVEVPPMTVQEKAQFATVMQIASGDLEPPRSPSRVECQSCNIAGCPDRDTSPELSGETKDF